MTHDLLFASSGIEAEICAQAEPLQVFSDVCVPVARLHHLIALKVLARDDLARPQDAADLRHLISSAEASDQERAHAAVRLIEVRGFNRTRNLTEALTSAWHEVRPCSQFGQAVRGGAACAGPAPVAPAILSGLG